MAPEKNVGKKIKQVRELKKVSIEELAERTNLDNSLLKKIEDDKVVPSLAPLTPQETVHAKTLYSAVNMLRRMPPGPIFAELVSNPAFQNVGDHYWLFDRSR